MAEEMLKVNEFEHGMDGPYHVHKSFQQLLLMCDKEVIGEYPKVCVNLQTDVR